MKIGIASGKGGTGKTTVAVNLYHVVAKYYDENVMLIDCDVEEPNDALFFECAKLLSESPVNLMVPTIDTRKCTFCRKCVEYCEFNAITVIPPLHHAEVSPDLCHSCGACLHACKFDAIKEIPHEIGKISLYSLSRGGGLTEGRLNVGSALQTPVIRHIKKAMTKADSISIFDAPPGTSCPVVTTISDVDFVILVTEPTPFGLHDLKLAVSVVRDLGKNFGVVINKSGMGDQQVENYLQDEEIMILEKIPFDVEIAKKYSGNQLLTETVPGYEKYFLNMIDKIINTRMA
jgi:MinD superfamily P-loop ATPase